MTIYTNLPEEKLFLKEGIKILNEIRKNQN